MYIAPGALRQGPGSAAEWLFRSRTTHYGIGTASGSEGTCNQGYEEELRSERNYVEGLYARLDAERARVKGRYNTALRGNGEALMERDAEVRALAKEVKRLDVADNGLCFGRLDSLSGETSYIGRIGLLDADNDYEPVLLDWRAPASRPFYVATAANPENMRRRRQFHTRSRHVVDFTDEVLGRPDCAEHDTHSDSALLAAVNAPRGEGMRDIVATIQAEQDDIVRLEHPGVLGDRRWPRYRENRRRLAPRRLPALHAA